MKCTFVGTTLIIVGFLVFEKIELECLGSGWLGLFAVQCILPTYTLPTRKTISSSLIPKLYQTTKDKVLLQLKTEADAICLTTDGWTSTSNTSFVALTAHYIDQNSLLKSVLLGCIEFDERHTAENLFNFLINEVEAWGISNKITGIITDNAANIVAAVHLTSWRHFPCFAHTVNLVVQHSLNNIKRQLDRVKAIVQYFKHSSSAESKLTAMQNQMELPPLKLKQSVVTRWNSTYDMLQRLLKIKDAVISTLAIEQPRLNTLTMDDWLLIENCVKVLKIFYDVTEEMSAEKSVSMSKVLVLVKIMKTHVENCIAENAPSAQPDEYDQLLRTLNKQLNERFFDVEGNVLAAEASFLDPRFKKHAFTNKVKYDNCMKSIKGRLRGLCAREDATLLQVQDNLPPQPSTSGNIWASFDKEVENEIIKNPTAASIVELDKYINEPLIKRTDDPLKWWNERRLLYPHLYTLMKRRLCLQATSVPCERIFSKAGMTITNKRSSLKPKKASQILFLNHNLE
ncbi:zinc finger BED domain-containing protein 1-like [Trichoplusia ni]|uniref:Zinc finger BED domain-containing protein 1-like n=1 Tax=Trichoplusia ni TaxID=7111 RepID=A0A7E5W7I6_TRINI|nr:zinc finger BED domain-containing protein 1-like [Trichoplusia ni]